MAGMSLNDFLGHQTSAPKGAFLGDWKKRPEHSVNVWLHRVKPWSCTWRHSMSRVVEKDDGSKEVWSSKWTCHESEQTLRNQFKHTRDGERTNPPEHCPICKMLEWIGKEIHAERLDWTTPLFRFEGDDPDKTVTYHAGGMIGMFGDRKLDDADKRTLRAKGIFVKDAWKEVSWAKASYVFCLVEHESAKSGVQIDVEPALLGDKLRTEIRKALTSKGKELGDPLKNPYAFQFQFDPRDNLEFNKKYDVVRMDNLELTADIAELLASDPPDTSMITDAFDPDLVRMELEAHALVEMPFDDWFPAYEKKPASRPAPVPVPQPKPSPRPIAVQATPVPAQVVADDDQIVCDHCGKPISLDDKKCPHCGFIYEEEVVPPPPPPPVKVVKTRAQLLAEKAAAQSDSSDLPF